MRSSSNFFTTSITDAVKERVAQLDNVASAAPDEFQGLANTALALLRAMIANPANAHGVTKLLEQINFLKQVTPESFQGVETLLSNGESLARLCR